MFFSCEFCEISKNTFFYRTPLVAAPEIRDAGDTKVILEICFGQVTKLSKFTYALVLAQIKKLTSNKTVEIYILATVSIFPEYWYSVRWHFFNTEPATGGVL